MEPRIEFLPQRKLVGQSIETTLSDDKTVALWQQFIPIQKSLKNSVSNDFFSVQIYDPSIRFDSFTPQTVFTRWAAVEVSNFKDIPDALSPLTLQGGLYAIFIHKGSSETFHNTSQYIFGEWLPNSDYALDQREHFEILGSKYLHNSPESEEEVWIPIKFKE